MTGVGDEAVEAASRGCGLGRRVQKAKVQLQAAFKEFSAQSLEVKALRGEQTACMAEIRKLHQGFVKQLRRGSEVYVGAMERERQNERQDVRFPRSRSAASRDLDTDDEVAGERH